MVFFSVPFSFIYFVAGVPPRDLSAPQTNDAQIFVHNGQILEVMLAHDFPCLIQRVIFEAIIHFLLYHDFANKGRLGIMAKAAAFRSG